MDARSKDIYREALRKTLNASTAAVRGPGGSYRVKRDGTSYLAMRMPTRPGEPPQYYRAPAGETWDVDDAINHLLALMKEENWAGARPFSWDKFGLAKILQPLPRAHDLEKAGINVQRLHDEASLVTQPKRVFPIPNLPGLEPQWLVYRPRLTALPKGDTLDPAENFQGLLPLFAGQPRGLGTNTTVVLRQGDLIGIFPNKGYAAPTGDFRRYLVVFPEWRNDCAVAAGKRFAELVRHGQFQPWDGSGPQPTLNSDVIPSQDPEPATPPLADKVAPDHPSAPGGVMPAQPALPSNYEVQQAVVAYSKGLLAANPLPTVVETGQDKFTADFFATNPVGQQLQPSSPQRLDAYNALAQIFSALQRRTYFFRTGSKPPNIRVIPSATAGGAKSPPLVLAKGSPLLALYEDGHWYPATLVRYNAKKNDYTVRWDDGGAVEIVEKIRPPAKLAKVEPGMVVEVHYSDDGWYPAKVVRTVPGTSRVRIAWITNGDDHGVEEETTLDKLRAAPEGTAEGILDYPAAQNGNDQRKLDYLHALWNQLNDTKFAGKMTLPNIIFMRNVALNKMKGRGYWQASKRIIAVNKRLFNSTADTVYEVFLHEMCHQAVSEIDFTVEREAQGHGPIWSGWMTRVGLDPRRYDPRENTEYMTPEERAEHKAKQERKAAATAEQERLLSPQVGGPAKWYDVKADIWHVGRLGPYEGGKYKRWVFVSEETLQVLAGSNNTRVSYNRIPFVMLYKTTIAERLTVMTPTWEVATELVTRLYTNNKERKRAVRTQARWGY